MRQLLSLLQKLIEQIARPMSLPLVDLTVGVIGLALAGVIGRATQAFHDAFQVDAIERVIVQVGGYCIMAVLILYSVAVLFMALYLTWLKFRVKYAQEKEKLRNLQDAQATKPGIKTPSAELSPRSHQLSNIAVSPPLEEARAGGSNNRLRA